MRFLRGHTPRTHMRSTIDPHKSQHGDGGANHKGQAGGAPALFIEEGLPYITRIGLWAQVDKWYQYGEETKKV